MIIIPEKEIVVILTPRTGSGALRRAIVQRYPEAVLLYRHMEADGVPAGYDRWRRVGVVRHPVDRLWSLYKFLGSFDGPHDAAYITAMRNSVAMSFDDWLCDNLVVFTSPYDRAGRGRYWPQYTVRHPLPENHKSQFLYLRPDLGTEIIRYDEVHRLWQELDLPEVRHNVTELSRPPQPMSARAMEHILRVHAWDIEATLKTEVAA